MPKIKNTLLFVFFTVLLCACQGNLDEPVVPEIIVNEPVFIDVTSDVELVVLGTVQDAGSPQIGCQKSCCIDLFENPDYTRQVVSLGLIDHKNAATYVFDATPDLPRQMALLNRTAGFDLSKNPKGVFLTHAHIGHYTGLMYFGKEATNASQVPVYVMPRMGDFLETNGPWSQLVTNENIVLEQLSTIESTDLSDSIRVTPFLVPHRDEYSETVGFLICGPSKMALFIPDIDKWEKWDESIIDHIEMVDYAFLDATFYSGEEINNRDISEIPHPFVIESLEKFKGLSPQVKKRIHFIHFNHTNPLLNPESEAYKTVISAGFNVATYGDRIFL